MQLTKPQGCNVNNNEFTLPKALDSILSSILRYEADGSPFTIYELGGLVSRIEV
jgi:hypothetical protein